MTYQPSAISDGLRSLPKLPPWVTSKRAETPKNVAVRSGAVLLVLDQLISDPSHVVGQGASVEMLIEDIQAELAGQPYEPIEVSGSWMFRTKTQFVEAIKAIADLCERTMAFNEMEMVVACHQPIDRATLTETKHAAYICDDRAVSPGDVRSAEPAGYA